MSPTLIIIAVVTLLSAAVAMTLRNLIHSALLLIASWAGIAAFYLWAGAEFVSFAQILVYVGAVSMIVLFAVVLTRRSRVEAPPTADSMWRAVLALLVTALVAGVIGGAVLSSPLPSAVTSRPSISVRELGLQLGGPHAAALLIAGVLLTVALLGAVVIAAIDKEDVS